MGALAFCAATLAFSSASAQTLYSDAGILEMLGFGTDVAVASGRVFVGEPGRIMGPGVVFVYEKLDEEWTEVAEISAREGVIADGFGSVVVGVGDVLVVSASAAGPRGQGLLYVFERDPDSGRWLQLGTFGPDSDEVGGFATATAVHGDLIVLGWPRYDDLRGRAEILRRGADGWARVARLSPPEGTDPMAFGAAVAVHGNRVIITAPLADGQVGAAYEYRVTDDSTEYVTKLTPGGAPPNGLFGAALELDAGRAVVNAPNRTLVAGTLYVFRRNPIDGSWSETALISSPDGIQRDGFGTAFALADASLWVGAPGSDGGRGGVYVYETSVSGDWTEGESLTYQDSAPGDAFGVSVAVDPRYPIAVVSAVGTDHTAGSILVYERDDGGWKLTAEIASEPEALPDSFAEPGRCDGGRVSGFECSNVELVSFVPVSALGGGRGIQVNDMWGWTDPESGFDYAIVGRTDGTSFLDVTDPSNPIYVGDLPRTVGTPIASWRDVKVFRDHAYIVADGSPGHGMQIFDLTRLREFDGTPLTYDSDARYEGVSSAHNLAINEESGFAYILGANGGGRTCGGGLHMVDLSDPTGPIFVGCFSDPLTGRSNTGYTHDAQCVMYHGPDQDYAGRELCFGANETALSIADVTDKDNVVAVSRASYPDVAYAHQGWLTEDHRYFFLGDELDEANTEDGRTRTLVWDITDLDDPQLVTEYRSDAVATDHNLYVHGTLMYQANYEAGLRIVDISDPENPLEIGFFDTVPYQANSVAMSGAWTIFPFFDSGVILVTSRWEGLFILKKREPIT